MINALPCTETGNCASIRELPDGDFAVTGTLPDGADEATVVVPRAIVQAAFGQFDRDLSGWSAEENAEWESRYGPEAAAKLRAANDRVWAIVRELRETAVTEGRDPYLDPMAQRLSGALVGVDAGGFCNLPHQSTDEEDACGRRHYARGGVVSGDVSAGFDLSGCTFPMPSRVVVETDSRVQFRMLTPEERGPVGCMLDRLRLDMRTPEQSRAYLQEHRDEQIAQGIPADVIDALTEATYNREEPEA